MLRYSTSEYAFLWALSRSSPCFRRSCTSLPNSCFSSGLREEISGGGRVQQILSISDSFCLGTYQGGETEYVRKFGCPLGVKKGGCYLLHVTASLFSMPDDPPWSDRDSGHPGGHFSWISERPKSNIGFWRKMQFRSAKGKCWQGTFLRRDVLLRSVVLFSESADSWCITDIYALLYFNYI